MIRIVAADTAVTTDWMALRTELWPETSPDDHRPEIAATVGLGASEEINSASVLGWQS